MQMSQPTNRTCPLPLPLLLAHVHGSFHGLDFPYLLPSIPFPQAFTCLRLKKYIERPFNRFASLFFGCANSQASIKANDARSRDEERKDDAAGQWPPSTAAATAKPIPASPSHAHLLQI